MWGRVPGTRFYDNCTIRELAWSLVWNLTLNILWLGNASSTFINTFSVFEKPASFICINQKHSTREALAKITAVNINLPRPKQLPNWEPSLWNLGYNKGREKTTAFIPIRECHLVVQQACKPRSPNQAPAQTLTSCLPLDRFLWPFFASQLSHL